MDNANLYYAYLNYGIFYHRYNTDNFIQHNLASILSHVLLFDFAFFKF